MFIAGDHGNRSFCIYKKPGKIGNNYDKKELDHILKNKIIESAHMFISGATGSAKTSLTMKIAEEFHKHGFTIIILSSKWQSEFDFGSVSLLPSQETEGDQFWIHNRFLKRQNESPTCYPFKIYHPFTFEIPTKILKNLPDTMNFFTLPIKALSEETLTTLFGGDIDKKSLKFVKKIIDQMDKKQNIYELLWEVYQRIEESDDELSSAEESSGYVPDATTATKTTRKEIINAFDYYKSNPLLDVISKRNMDFESMIRDQKTYHLLSLKWVSNPTARYFNQVCWIENIMQTLGSIKNAPPVLLVLEELGDLLPRKKKDSSPFQEVLSDSIKRVLAISRKIGSTQVVVVGNSQRYFETDSNYVTHCDIKFIGKSDPSDWKILRKAHDFSVNRIRELEQLDPGQFMVWEKDCPVLIMPMPRHAIPVKGFDYITAFETLHPERMKDFTSEFEEIKSVRKEWTVKSKEILDKMKDKRKKQEDDKKNKQEMRKLSKEFEQETQIIKLKDKEKEKELELAKKCYTFIINGNPSRPGAKMSLRLVALDVLGNENKKNKAKRLIEMYKKLIEEGSVPEILS